MQITFDPFNLADMNLISSLLSLSVPAKEAQSEVASNTDTTATGSTPSHPEGSGVTGAVVAGEIPEAKTAPAPVKTRAKKEAAVQVEKQAPTDAPTADTESSSTTEAALSLDDVRAALQAFTASNGMPEGIAVLKSFQAVRVSELKPEQYADFIKACAV